MATDPAIASPSQEEDDHALDFLDRAFQALSTRLAKIILALIGIVLILYLLVSNLSDPSVRSATVYGSLFGLMALGLTLTYITTKVPNFAYGSFVTVGIYTSYTMWRLYHITPYVSAIPSFMIGAGVSVGMYMGILRPLAKRGASLVSLMIATLAVDIGFIGVFGIYAEYLYNTYRLIDSPKFPPIFNADFSVLGIPGIVVLAPTVLVGLSIIVFLLLTRTKFGISMRASVENPNLARVLGINVDIAYIFAWLLAGGFAALSGSYYVVSQGGSVEEGSNLIVEIFAASVLGGLASIYGAIVGGLVIGASETLVTSYLAGITVFANYGVIGYQKGIPLLIMIITLILFPQGLVSIEPRKTIRAIIRLPSTIWSTFWYFIHRLQSSSEDAGD